MGDKKSPKSSSSKQELKKKSYASSMETKISLSAFVKHVVMGGDWSDQTPPQSTLEIPNYNWQMLQVEKHFRRASLAAAAVYALLVHLSYKLAGDSKEELSQLERLAAFLAFVCLLTGLLILMLPAFFYRKGQHMSGVVFAAMVISTVAMVTNCTMAYGSPPILIDPRTGARVHLLRWSEWTPLAFAMTFLVEGSDVPDPRLGLKVVYVSALAQGFSSLAGWLFPFCKSNHIWFGLLAVSMTLYLYIFLRLWNRIQKVRKINKGRRLDELEIYNRSQISLKLLKTCAVGWTFLVVMYMTFSILGPTFAPEGSLLRHQAVPMITEAFIDVVLKLFYLHYILEMHRQVFDEGARAKRRLEELRQMMWNNSSDVLAISVQSLSGVVTTMVSPAFAKLLRQGKSKQEERLRVQDNSSATDRGMIFELTKDQLRSLLSEDGGKKKPSVTPKLYDFDFEGVSIQNAKQKVLVDEEVTYLVGRFEMQALAHLMARSWQCEQRDTLLAHDLMIKSNDKNGLETIQCEAKVTRLEESALFVVVRDVSERFRRFEAEKIAVSEMTARRKDAEANRFTRHEVKNGLLSALGLCESLSETLQSGSLTSKEISELTTALGEERASTITKVGKMQENIEQVVAELATAVHEVMDTVLSEAMAREVVHGEYAPQLERVNVLDLLTKGSFDRFPVTSSQSPFPDFLFDPLLLKCIHRNAVSNACKYGKRGGSVTTSLSYDSATGTFQMDVTNQPGEHHADIVELGTAASEEVFLAGRRLHPELGNGEQTSSIARHSSGDGAWIMQKCAKTFGGECSISFRPDCTVFTFQCPATPFDETLDQKDMASKRSFRLPKKTWGIAVDDSKIQRKLLKRFLLLAGIKEERIVILGNTAEEIMNVDQFVIDFVENHPGEHFLLIVDENLDVKSDSVHTTTISGSLTVQTIRQRMLPEHERQMLALIRSANDSSHDIAIYNARAHGVIPKAPIKKEGVIEKISELWESRFFSDGTESMASASSNASLQSLGSEDFSTDLFAPLRAVDEIVESTDDLHNKWSEIWKLLHTFKGDLLTSQESSEVSAVVGMINEMRGRTLPLHFDTRWPKLRDAAMQLDLSPP